MPKSAGENGRLTALGGAEGGGVLRLTAGDPQLEGSGLTGAPHSHQMSGGGSTSPAQTHTGGASSGSRVSTS